MTIDFGDSHSGIDPEELLKAGQDAAILIGQIDRVLADPRVDLAAPTRRMLVKSRRDSMTFCCAAAAAIPPFEAD